MDEQQLQQVSVEYGKKIAFLLEQVDMPHELKMVLADVIPTLELEQIDAVAESLEQMLVSQVAIESTDEYKEVAPQIDKETIAELDTIIKS